MAKKQKLNLDDFDLDKDLDFNFGLDDIDGSINPDIKKPKGRKPVSDVFTGTIKGASSKLKDPGFIAKTIQDSLPKQYGEVFTAADKVTSSLSSLYDDTIREIKPELNRISKKVDRLVPEESKFFKRLTTKFSEFMGAEFKEYKQATKEQIQEQSIANALATVFEAQQQTDAAVQARAASESRIQDAIEQKRFTSNFSLLSGINEGISRLSVYNEKVNQAFQKKSLELQYRSFFVQSELLSDTRQYFEVFKSQNEAIAKNTSLPEFVKVKDSERFKDLAKNKFYSSIQKGIFGDTNIVEVAMKRLREKAKTTIADFKQGLEMGMMGLETLEATQEQLKDMKEAGIDVGSKYDMLGNFIGGTAAEALGAKLSKKARAAIPEDSPLARYGYKAANFLRGGQNKVEDLRNSKFMQENRFGGGAKGILASLADFGLDLIKPEAPNMRVREAGNLGNLNDIAPGFTNKAIKSITDIIPGYLARIWREITMLRTKATDAPMPVYDFTKDQFSTTGKLTADIKKMLTTKIGKSGYGRSLDNALTTLTGGEKFSEDPETQKYIETNLKKILSELSTQGIDYTPENIYKTEAYAKSPVKVHLKKLLNKKVTKAHEGEKGQYELTKAIGDIRDATPDIRGEIEQLIKSGYSDQLEELGLIKRGENGEIDINFDTYKKLVKDETIATSDVNVKRNIKGLNPKDALEAVKKTKIYDWFYKLGKGDQRPHTGPMAQDVKAHLGEGAAPGGTKIDLTTMNGVNMAAIQALKDEQDKHAKSDTSKLILESIKKDTGKIVELMSQGGGTGGINIGTDKLKELLESRKGFYTSVVEPTIKGAFGAMSKLFGVAKEGTDFGKNQVAKPLVDFISKTYQDNKSELGKRIRSLFTGAADIALNVMNFGRDVIFKHLPTGLKELASMAGDIKTKITKLLSGPVDLYVKNSKVPLVRANLMKMGYYIDQTTGKVIESIQDIKGPVVNKLGEVILSVEDLAQGLVDKDGKEILTPFEKLTKAAIGMAARGFNRVKNFYSHLANGAVPDRIKSWFTSKGNGSLGGNDKVYDVLVEIRDILKGQSTTGTGGSTVETSETEAPETEVSKADTTAKYKGGTGFNIGSLLGKVKTGIGNIGGAIKASKGKGLKGLASGILGAFAGTGTEQPTNAAQTPVEAPQGEQEQETDDHKPVITKTVKKLSDRAKATWNDRDASGRREGDWRDRLEALAEKSKKKPAALKADLTAKYRSSENVIDMIARQASGLLSGLSKGAGGLFDTIGSVVEAGASGLGLGKLGGLLKGTVGKLKGLPGTLLGAGRAATGLLGKGLGLASKVGAPLVRGLSAVKNVATVGRLVSLASTARTALTVGSLMTAGVGSTIMGAAATGLSALAGALVSAPVLGAVAIGATAYGAYRAYKYFTQDNINPFESIRMKQYGLLNSDHDKHHNHELIQLEEYLQDGRVGYDRGKAYLLPKKIDMNEMLGIFNIDVNDESMTNRYTEWFEYRFKPFFLTNMTALYAVNNKAKLSEVNKFNTEDQSKFLQLSSFESGPYDVQVSPFKDIDRLNTDPTFVKESVKAAEIGLKKALAKKSTTPKDQLTAKVEAPIPIKDGTQYVLKPEREKLPKTNITPSGKDLTSMEANAGDDGQPKSLMQVNYSTTPVQTAAMKVNIAAGPMSDGESGMQYVKIQPGVRLDGLNPSLLSQFKSMVQEYGETTGKSVVVTSGYRDRATQEALYRQDPSKAAKPGRSLHEFGLALDVNSADLDALDKLGLMRKYGFTRPVGGEPWHTEAAGIQVNLDKAKQDPSFASQAIEASLLKGGGGLGSIPGSPLRKRDTELALKTMELRDAKTIKSDKDAANAILTPSKPAEEPDQGQTFGTVPKSNVIQASFGGTTSGGYAGSASTTGKSNVVPFTGVSAGGGYAGSVANTISQGQAYSKNDQLFEPESRPSSGGGEPEMGKQPQNKDEVIKVIHDAAAKTGTDPHLLTAFAAVESGMNPNAKAGSSSASGLFQFTKATWNQELRDHGQQYGLGPNTSPFNATANSLMASEYVKSNLKMIEGVKPNPNLTDAYLAHFLGPGGARKFLRYLQTNPDAIASVIFQSEARANPGIFMPGGRSATFRQVYQMLSQRLVSKARSFGVDVPESTMQGAGGESMGSEPVVGSPLPNQETGTAPQWKIIPGSKDNQAYDTQSTAGSSYGSMPVQKQPTFSQPAMPSYPSPVTSGTGQGFGMGGLESGINHVGETLDKSLGVQTEMLTTLKEILANVNPQNMGQVQEGLKQVAAQAKPTGELSKPAIELTRKSA